MDEVKRRPGRPKGSEIDDSAPLMAMARLLTDEPKLAPKTAARRVFRSGKWGRSSEDASIHRWQGKWNAVEATYMQRVQDDRVAAGAERQRRERAAEEKRRADRRPMWEFAAELRDAGHLPDWQMGNALREAFAQHRDTMGKAASYRDQFTGFGSAAAAAGRLPGLGTFAGYQPPAAMATKHLTVFELMEEARRPGSALGEAMRATRGVLDNPGLRETMRKYGEIGDALRKHREIGQALAESGALGTLAKLAGGFLADGPSRVACPRRLLQPPPHRRIVAVAGPPT